MTSRREFIRALAAGSAAGVLPGLTLAAPGSDQRRFVLVILRGGLDGLATVVPYGDPGYAGARRGLALEPPGGSGGLRDLDGFFALHPMLATLHGYYGRGELIAMHAVASTYRRRSHFDAQNVLELGLVTPHASRQGWLNRALPVLGTRTPGPSGDDAMAIGQAVPLVLRGPESVGSWAPARLPGPDDDLMDRLLALYGSDAFLGPRLDAALNADRMAGGGLGGRTRPGEQFGKLAEVAARMLVDEAGPRIAVIETGGWDTHANQGRETGALAQRLRRLDEGLGRLAAGMGPGWRHTVVLVVTEFGRTVAMNGTRGTDHGTAGMALMLGGAVNGGRVVGDWPGLAPGRLHEGRDLAPATDLRSIYKGILRDHLGVAVADLDSRVFPSSRAAQPASGLIRT
jgi:uncharacterized protein (DUF1501 family)